MTVEKTEALDWSRCPLCGAIEDFGVHSEEKLWATNTLNLPIEGRHLAAAEFTISEPVWESSVTVAYFTDCCGQELPEAYQDALDEALQNYRDPEA